MFQDCISHCEGVFDVSVRMCAYVCVFALSRARTAGWWRCSSYIISISLPHSDREEGGSCRLPSRHLQPAEASLLSSSLRPLSSPLRALHWFGVLHSAVHIQLAVHQSFSPQTSQHAIVQTSILLAASRFTVCLSDTAISTGSITAE